MKTPFLLAFFLHFFLKKKRFLAIFGKKGTKFGRKKRKYTK